jgi:hypothetical protein
MMSNEKENELKLTITQDKLVDILMHAATREDIAKLDAKLDKKIDDLEKKMDAKYDKIIWSVIIAILVPIALQALPHFVK